MQSKTRFIIKPVLGTALLAALIGAPTLASAWGTDFESGPGATPGSGYDLYYGATRTTAISQSPSHSIELSMTSEADTPLIRFLPTETLGTLNGQFSTFVSASSPDLAPYMYFGVDTNQDGIWEGDGGGDSLVIAFSGGAIPNTITHESWFTSGLDSATNVHVVGNRAGLTAGTYSASGTQDTLANLRSMSLGGSTSWGDLNVLRAYIAVGNWPGVSSYTAYVDDVNFAPVPEPATMTVLGLGALVAIRRRRRN